MYSPGWFTVLFAFWSVTTARHLDFFRKDYVHIKKYNDFYKMHWGQTSWVNAFLTCNSEEATLFYPQFEEEWKVVNLLMENSTEKPNVTDIFVGYHDQFGIGEFITVDGHTTSSPLLEKDSHIPKRECMLMDIKTGGYKIGPCSGFDLLIPFVCRKRDLSCPTIDQGYRYIESLNRCYKINDNLKTWQDAMQTCFMEGAMLAVMDSTEVDPVSRLLNKEQYFVGIHALRHNSEYFDVRGKKSTFNQDNRIKYDNNMNEYQENNINEHQEAKNCLYFQKNSQKYDATNCDEKLPFICAMDVN